MLKDLLARVFVSGFFLVYVVVGVLLVQWALRTAMGRLGRRRSFKSNLKSNVKSKATETAEAPSSGLASEDRPPSEGRVEPQAPQPANDAKASDPRSNVPAPMRRRVKGAHFFSALPSASRPSGISGD